MITYICEEVAAVQAINSRAGVTLRATNYTHPHVMQLVMRSGGFFTKSHQEQSSQIAVLNEKAAFDLFGSVDIVGNEITINNERYHAVGVISDGDDTLHIYIPITLRQQSRPNSFAVRLDENVSKALVKNELKRIGVTDCSHDFTRGTVVDRAVDAVRDWIRHYFG
jgi:hypothetical protein